MLWGWGGLLRFCQPGEFILRLVLLWYRQFSDNLNATTIMHSQAPSGSPATLVESILLGGKPTLAESILVAGWKTNHIGGGWAQKTLFELTRLLIQKLSLCRGSTLSSPCRCLPPGGPPLRWEEGYPIKYQVLSWGCRHLSPRAV